MAIDVKRSGGLAPIQVQKRNVPTEQIIAAKGANPIAKGLETAGQLLGVALQRKMLQDQSTAREKLLGVQPGTLAQLPQEEQVKFGQAIFENKLKTQAEDAKRQAALPEIRMLEQDAGLPTGSLGSDPGMARLMYIQSMQNTRAEKMQQIRSDRLDQQEEIARRNRLNLQKQRMINDARIKPLYQQGINLGQIDDIANIAQSGNTVAAAALGVKMARGMGEVGVLTDSDVTRYITSGRLDRRAADILSRWIRGVPTDATIDEIRQISGVLRERFSEKIQPVYNEYMEQTAATEGLAIDEVSRRWAVPYNQIPLRPIQPGGGKTITVGKYRVTAQ